MTSVRNNVVANLSAQAFSIVLGLLIVPFYIRLLGIEAYGLIGFFLSLQAAFAILDMGLSATLSRELARYNHTSESPDIQRDLVRTLEWIYWPIGLLLATFVAIASEAVATKWLKPTQITIPEATQALQLMGIAAALQWPTALYAGGFRGLERQVALSTLSIAASALRIGGALIVLTHISATLEALLWWQVFAASLQTLFTRVVFWRMLPRGTRSATFNSLYLRRLKGFMAGLTVVAAFSFLMIQSDRLILSTVLPLSEFGHYVLASTVAGTLLAFAGPFFNALYPRYSGLVSAGKNEELIGLYHLSNQVLVLFLAPVAAVVAFFSTDLLFIWTSNAAVATQAGPVLTLLVVGTALNGLGHLPYALQLAHGWTKLATYQTFVSACIFVPSVWYAAHRFGGIGAASIWVILHVVTLVVVVPMMHAKLLPGELLKWVRVDLAPPIFAATACAWSARVLFPLLPTGLAGISALGAIGIVTLLVTSLACPFTRSKIVAATRAFRAWAGA